MDFEKFGQQFPRFSDLSIRDQILIVGYYLYYQEGREKFFISDVREVLDQHRIAYSNLGGYVNSLLSKKYIKQPRNAKKGEYQVTTSQGDKRVEELYPKGQTFAPIQQDINEIISIIGNEEYRKYLEEAARCLSNDCYRASIVLGWCSVIFTINEKLKELRYSVITKALLDMKKESKKQPFKYFNKNRKVTNDDELFEIFDSDKLMMILWLNIIDKQQYERLMSCYKLRCHASHPADIEIEKENALGFFRDIINMILNNPKFAVKSKKSNSVFSDWFFPKGKASRF